MQSHQPAQITFLQAVGHHIALRHDLVSTRLALSTFDDLLLKTIAACCCSHCTNDTVVHFFQATGGLESRPAKFVCKAPSRHKASLSALRRRVNESNVRHWEGIKMTLEENQGTNLNVYLIKVLILFRYSSKCSYIHFKFQPAIGCDLSVP